MRRYIFLLYLATSFLANVEDKYAVASSGDEACVVNGLERLIEANGFTTGRGLVKYLEQFPPAFGRDLLRLKQSGHWIDSGAGEVIAGDDFLSSRLIEVKALREPTDHDIVRHIGQFNQAAANEKPRVTAITYVINREPSTYGGRLKILKGRFLEDIPNEEIGKADLITDYFGPFAYSPRVDLVIKKYLDLLNKKGVAYIYYGRKNLNVSGQIAKHQRVKEQSWSLSTGMLKTLVRTKDGRELNLFDWMKSIEGLEVKGVYRVLKNKSPKGWRPVMGHDYTIQLKKKIGQEVRIPKLKLIASEDGSPPTRIFEEE